MAELVPVSTEDIIAVADTLSAPGLNRCFVVGPIGNKFAMIGSPERESYEDALEVFEKVIVPACQAFDLDPVRADQIAVSGAVTEQVLRHLYEDEIVIADVSGGNPNVMYELGLRHTRDLLTILIGEYGQLPFDIADIRTIQFSRSDRGLIDARKSLERAIQAGLDELPEPIAATRLWNRGAEPSTETQSLSPVAVPAELDEEEDYFDQAGLVDRLAAMEDSFPLLTQISESIGATLTQLGEVATSSSEELNLANASSQSARARLTVIAKFAQALQPSADELALQTTRFHAHMEGMDDELNGLLSFVEKHPEMDQDIDGFLDSLVDMAKSSREAMESIGGFGTIVDGLGELSRALKRPARQISEAVRVMTSSVEFTDNWDRRARRIKQMRAASDAPTMPE